MGCWVVVDDDVSPMTVCPDAVDAAADAAVGVDVDVVADVARDKLSGSRLV